MGRSSETKWIALILLVMTMRLRRTWGDRRNRDINGKPGGVVMMI
jgi:hypothetical protein